MTEFKAGYSGFPQWWYTNDDACDLVLGEKDKIRRLQLHMAAADPLV